jgi:hypothetical protein
MTCPRREQELGDQPCVKANIRGPASVLKHETNTLAGRNYCHWTVFQYWIETCRVPKAFSLFLTAADIGKHTDSCQTAAGRKLNYAISAEVADIS